MDQERDDIKYSSFLIWSLVSFLISGAFIIQRLIRYTIGESKALSNARCVIIVSVVFLLMTIWSMIKIRDYRYILANIVISWGVYVAVSYSDLFNPSIWKIALLNASVACILVLVYLRGHRSEMNEAQENRKFHLWKSLETARIVAAIFFAGLIFLVLSSGVAGLPVIVSNSGSNQRSDEQLPFERDEEQLKYLYSDKWDELSLEGRLEICQFVADLEKEHLGINHPLQVYCEEIADIESAYYDTAKEKLIINSEFLKSCTAKEMVKAILPGAYNAYQWSVIDLYESVNSDYKNLLFFRNAQEYLDELSVSTRQNNENISYMTGSMLEHALEYGNERYNKYYLTYCVIYDEKGYYDE